MPTRNRSSRNAVTSTNVLAPRRRIELDVCSTIRAPPSGSKTSGGSADPTNWAKYVLRRITGVLAVDYSNASSLALLDPRTRRWSQQALDALELDGTVYGICRHAGHTNAVAE